MKSLIKWIFGLGADGTGIKKIVVDGKETAPAKGRTKRIKAQREVKEKLSRSGNLSTEFDSTDDSEVNWNQ